MLFRVDITSGDVMCFDVAPDGVLFDPRYPTAKTGFKLVVNLVEYSPSTMPVGWWSVMKHDGDMRHPTERVLSQKKGYCDNVLWTQNEQLARTVAEACTIAKERSVSARWPV